MKKETIPPHYVRIQDMPRELERWNIKISYRGLRHYINVGLIPRPEKFKGIKEKYYDPTSIAQRLIGIKYCSNLFHLNHSSIYKIFSSAPEVIDRLPGIFIMSYARAARAAGKKMEVFAENAFMVGAAGDIFYQTFLEVVEQKLKKKQENWDGICKQLSKEFESKVRRLLTPK